ncbi:MAG: DUF4238 domain-containing protein, partial [Desulfobaccales bacterium]
MAGNRQHILPKFLLKGFPNRIENGKIFTWVYPRNQKPIEANIRKVCVEKYFYGKLGESSADDDITKLENEYAPLLDELRVRKMDGEISDQRIPQLITHLVIRTKHIRDSFRESSEYLAGKILAYLSKFDNLKAALLSKPELINGFIEENLRDYQGPQVEKDTLRQLIPILYPAFLDTLKKEMLTIIIHLQ